MVKRGKRRIRFAVAVLFALAGAAWGLGHLFLDVQRPIRDDEPAGKRLPASSGESLREIFETFRLKGDPDCRVELLEDNSGAWAARWRLLDAADETLDVSYFILDRDIFGYSFLGHLLRKARDGVRIRILLDAFGTKLSRDISGNDYLDTMASLGNVTVKMYRPLFFRFTDAFLTLNPTALAASDHDKILVANGRLAMVGGRNIGEDYFADPKDAPKAFRDMDVLLEGRAIGARLEAVFEADFRSGEARAVRPDAVDVVDWGEDILLAYRAMDAWLRGKPVPEETGSAIRRKGLSWLDDLAKLPRLRGVLAEAQPAPVAAEVRLLDSRPRFLESGDPVSVNLLRLVRGAKHHIFIQTPYLVLPREIVPILEEAAARGVRITVLTNSPLSSDNALSQAFFLEQWPELLARVPTLRLFVVGDRHNLHSKVGTVDDRLALIGTYNIDPVSMAVNGEVVAAFWSEPLCRRLLGKARRLISAGPPAVYEYRIGRDAQGRPERDDEGKAVVAFGPRDHSAPSQWKDVERYWTLLRIAKKLPGLSRLLW
ncbi:MAG TPA: phosphatidylserine/phosphatidylglycerophosphate/cardiolipin synthase family protein, partial [Candidatus Aquicultoraceae bacterium]|nr:phosphatidylserine/phosphatidylglycerophosphate/cardiolipin synthase family protein [Candidatus Aquicultoraceae bacterium]